MASYCAVKWCMSEEDLIDDLQIFRVFGETTDGFTDLCRCKWCERSGRYVKHGVIWLTIEFCIVGSYSIGL